MRYGYDEESYSTEDTYTSLDQEECATLAEALKKRAVPAGANTTAKAAKTTKTSAHARQVRRERSTRWSRTEPLPTNHTARFTNSDAVNTSFKQVASSGGSTSKFTGVYHRSVGNWGSRIKVVQIVVNVQIGVSD